MRQLTFALCSLLLASPLIDAVPSSPQHGASSQEQHIKPWQRLSETIFRKFWKSSEIQAPIKPIIGDDTHLRPSGTLVAKYGGDLVLRFNITTVEEATALAEASNTLFLDVWEFNENWVDIRLAKDVVPSLLGLLPESLQDAHVPLMQDLDLAQAIFESYPSPSSTQPHGNERFTPSLRTSSNPDSIFFSDYQPLSVITPWMNLMASMFPSHVRRINVGVSYEGRDIPALRIGVHPTNDERSEGPRQTVLITGGSHAREWISTSTANYLAWSLITAYGKSVEVTQMLQAFDWVFVPTLNPDGYVYSWDTDRLWRKNRQPTNLRFCRGLDLDRSYSFQWDGESTRENPCSESYAGADAFEGVESKRFADWARNETENNNTTFIAFLDLHSYSEQILYPYSYSCNAEPPSLEDLEELAFGLAKAMRISHGGHFYKVTSACEGNVAVVNEKKEKVLLPRMETGGGSALDWFYHEMKVRYAYQIKLRDTGSYGFLLPKENIVPTGKEVMQALVYLGKFLMGEVGLEEEGQESPKLGESRPLVPALKGEDKPLDKDADSLKSEDGMFWDLRRRRRR